MQTTGGSTTGQLTTRPLRLDAQYMPQDGSAPSLWLNVNASAALTVALLAGDGSPLASATVHPIDSTKTVVRWDGAANSSTGVAQALRSGFRLRFRLSGATQLFSFWFSSDACGTSGGPVAAGGPPYTSARDDHCALKSDDKTFHGVGSDARSSLPGLPRLSIDPSGITASGISSGADFAVQIAVAFSKTIRGVGVFAGQPYHCAVTRFPADRPIPCTHWNFTRPPGCQAGLSCEPACPAGQGLLWDHCKGCTIASKAQLLEHPDLVHVPTLTAYATAAASRGEIDPVVGLANMRTFAYHGSKDQCYLTGSVNKTADFFRAFAKDPNEQVMFSGSVPSLHSIPTAASTATPCRGNGSPCGTLCGTEGNYTSASPHGLEACGYDGAGECLRHLYGGRLRPQQPSVRSNILPFDQTDFGMNDTGKAMGFAREGYMYLPSRCKGAAARCRLHTFFHGCGMAFNSGSTGAGTGFNLTYVADAGFNAWAEANGIVILYPQKDDRVETCWDG